MFLAHTDRLWSPALSTTLAVVLAGFLQAAILVGAAPLARAASDPPAPAHNDLLTREVWAGVDVASNVWLVYSGATVAPFSHIHENGLRVRAVIGYGQYTYESYGANGRAEFEASTGFADVLVGYLYRYDALTMKVFAGLSFIDHKITPFDPENISIGGEWGPKAVLEFWYNSNAKSWTSLDLAYTTAHDTGSVRMRSGYRVWPQVSFGAEAALNIDGQAQCKIRLPTKSGCQLDDNDSDYKSLLDYGRAGVFARYEWTGGEVSISAGGMGQIVGKDYEITIDPYVTANWIMQF